MNEAVLNSLEPLPIPLFIAWLVYLSYRRIKLVPQRRYLTFAPRFWAVLVDDCVFWGVGFVVVLITAVGVPRGLAAILVLCETLVILMYTILMHARFGQTLGKMVTHVRIVDYLTEQPISLRQAFLREGIPFLVCIGYLGFEMQNAWNGASIGSQESLADSWSYKAMIGLLWVWIGLEVVTMMMNKKRRALHDYIAGTVVVRTNLREDRNHEEGPDRQCGQCGISLKPRREDCHWCGWKPA